MKPLAKAKSRYFSHCSLLLSLFFFLWWFIWPLLSLPLAWISAGRILQERLQALWQGLPLWFWLSCIASLPLLFTLSLLFLPEDLDDGPDTGLKSSADSTSGVER